MAPQIISASEDNLPALAAAARSIWLQHYPGIITLEQIEYMLAQRYSLTALRAEISTPDHWLEMLILGDNLLGFANYFKKDAHMKLDKLYLHEKYRGQGFGRLLIDHVCQAALREGCTKVLLAVNKNNQTAISAYQRNGFTIQQAVVVDIGGGFVMDDYLMIKMLVTKSNYGITSLR